MLPLRAYAPASIGNVAAGFDVLGMALQPCEGGLWGDVVTAAFADTPSLTCEGPSGHLVPAEPAANLVTCVAAFVAQEAGVALPALRLVLHKGLPVASGLGSSAASAVAGALAVNALLGQPLDTAGVLRAALRAEALASGADHLDNVAPCLLGGLRLIAPGGSTHPLSWPEDLVLCVASPDLAVSTRSSRAVLPTAVPLALAVAHAGNLAAFLHALATDDRTLLRATLRDLLAEPYRAHLVQGFRAVQAAALQAGALGCSLSGSGPAVFAVAPKPVAAAVAAAQVSAFAAAGVPAVARLCRVDPLGARLLS